MKTKDSLTLVDPFELTIWIRDVKICGRITKLDEYLIEVEIHEPYYNWKKQSRLSRSGKLRPNYFLYRYQEVGKRLLGDIYRTIKQLDESLDKYLESYQSLLKERELLYSISDKELSVDIESKVEDYFFDIFPYLSYRQRDHLETVLAIYLENGIRIYK
jgi:hypothetical protein